MFDHIDFVGKAKEFRSSQPFNHVVIDNFFDDELARNLSRNYPQYQDEFWKGVYNNPIEIKKANQSWSHFSPMFYKVFHSLLDRRFVENLSIMTGIMPLYVDHGLHGGGLHAHPRNGKLNVHLDYAIHPKLGLQRKLNLIVYLNEDWKEEWGGHIEFWSHDEEKNAPKECVKKVAPLFNRAVIFDTTQNSWHGLPEPLQCPEGEMRKSIAVYYLTDIDAKTKSAFRARFAPYKDQQNDQYVLDLIEKRSDNNTASSVYVTGELK
jgi:hypothetical protein